MFGLRNIKEGRRKNEKQAQRERDEKKIGKEENGMKHLSSCAGKTFRHVWSPPAVQCRQVAHDVLTVYGASFTLRCLTTPGIRNPRCLSFFNPQEIRYRVFSRVSRDNIYNTPLHYTGVDCPLLLVLTGNGWRIVRETSQEGWTQLVEDIKHRRHDTF